MTEQNVPADGDRTRRAAEEIQATTTEGWAADQAQDRCTATHQVSADGGSTSVRCDAQADHGGGRHQATVDGQVTRWGDD